MPRHLISDAHEWINEIPTVPIYYLAKPQPRERAWQNQRGKKTLNESTTQRGQQPSWLWTGLRALDISPNCGKPLHTGLAPAPHRKMEERLELNSSGEGVGSIREIQSDPQPILSR